MKLKILFVAFATYFLISCTSSKIVTTEKFNEILSKPESEWTYKDCENIISKYMSYNKNGYEEKYTNVNYGGTTVFIKAVPLNENVIRAKIRKESIIRRYSDEDYKLRLKNELEFYTNKTLNINDGRILLKSGIDRFQFDKLSFEIIFENISQPREPIEIEFASEAFFLENSEGEFSRVIEMSGYYVEDYFVVIDKLKAVITFSIYNDNGKPIFYGDNITKGYKLVFNGFQAEPIIVSWGEPILTN